jgi:5-deoxy-glucuronate isomerase
MKRRRDSAEKAMTDLLLKNHAPDRDGLVHRVTPESAGWGHVGFALYRLKPGQSLEASTGECEACLVLVGGRARVRAGALDFGEIGKRMGPFEGKKPAAVYVPWRSGYQVEATTELELGVCSAPAATRAMSTTSCPRPRPPIRCSWSR